MDTPGLQDFEMRKQAAVAITEALRKGGNYKIVFVITLEARRIRATDIGCMEMILDSADGQIQFYGLIVNKLSKTMYKKLHVPREEQDKILSQIQLGNVGLCMRNILLLRRYDELDETNNVVIDIPELAKLLDFLPSVPIEAKLNLSLMTTQWR